MAGFKTHISVSTTVGIGYGSLVYATFHVPAETCIVAGGLCSVAGILPDVDSESGQTVREITAFSACVVPLLLMEQLQAFQLSNEAMVVLGGSLYILIRFGLAELIARTTVHRGMWHSIPAAVIASLVASWLCNCPDLFPRFFKASAVFLGFMTHLLLDEYYSFELKRGRLRIKKSLGTAMKMFGKGIWANTFTYGLLIYLGFLTLGDPQITGRPGKNPAIPQLARDAVNYVLQSPQEDPTTRNVRSIRDHDHTESPQ